MSNYYEENRLNGVILKIILVVLGFSLMLNGQTGQPWPWQTNDEDVSILLFGDTNVQYRDNPVSAFKYVLPTFQEADFKMCNMEGALAGKSKDPKLPDIPHKENWTHSEPDMVEAFVEANIDAVSLANNVHYPWKALMKSIEVLDENNIKHAGGGENLDSAHESVILQKRGTKIGFLAYACTVFPFQHAATENIPGIASMRIHTYYEPPHKYDKPGTPPEIITIPYENELERMQQDINRLKKEVDIVIVSYHWGRTQHTELIDYQPQVAHAAIDAGADVIMGHGNHLLGAIEVWKSKPIFYSLGNMAFDWAASDGRPKGILARISAKDGKLERVACVPIYRHKDDNLARIKDPNQGIGEEMYKTIKKRSNGLSSMKIEGKEIFIDLK